MIHSQLSLTDEEREAFASFYAASIVYTERVQAQNRIAFNMETDTFDGDGPLRALNTGCLASDSLHICPDSFSCWMPTADDLEEIKKIRNLTLVILGTIHKALFAVDKYLLCHALSLLERATDKPGFSILQDTFHISLIIAFIIAIKFNVDDKAVRIKDFAKQFHQHYKTFSQSERFFLTRLNDYIFRLG